MVAVTEVIRSPLCSRQDHAGVGSADAERAHRDSLHVSPPPAYDSGMGRAGSTGEEATLLGPTSRAAATRAARLASRRGG